MLFGVAEVLRSVHEAWPETKLVVVMLQRGDGLVIDSVVAQLVEQPVPELADELAGELLLLQQSRRYFGRLGHWLWLKAA